MSKFVNGEFLIQFAAHMTPLEKVTLLRKNGAEFVDDFASSQQEPMLAKVNHPKSLEKAIDKLAKLPGVEFVQHNWVISNQLSSDDPFYTNGNLWGMYGDVTSPVNSYGSQAAEAWNSGFTGTTKTVVGVIDTGIDYTHPDLYLNIWINQKEISNTLRTSLTDVDEDSVISFIDLNHAANVSYVNDFNNNGRIDAGDLLADSRWEGGDDLDGNGYIDDIVGWDFVNNDNNPFDDVGHGTHVAGTIGATGDTGTGVSGVNGTIEMVALKALGPSGGTSLSTTAAINYYTNASLVSGTGQNFVATNNSWGGGGYSQSNYDAIVRSAQAGNLFVAAAGNSGLNTDSYANYPSNMNTTATIGFDAVISVAALTSSGTLASFSNYGKSTVDLAAPGQGIYSTVPGGGYASYQGTSMAAPHVTGALALYASALPDISAQQLRESLLSTVAPTSALTSTSVTGGRLDIGTMIAGVPPPPGVIINGGNYTGTTANNIMNAGAGDDILYGLAGNDTLNALAGNDILDGGAGSDKLYGGEGSDIYLVVLTADHGAAEFFDYGTLGTDEIRFAATVKSTLKIFAGDSGIERVVIGAGLGASANTSATTALNINAAAAANALTIIGNAGNNSLTGTAYVDQLDGGDGSDTYIINSSAHHSAAEITDTGSIGIDVVSFAATAPSTLTLYAGDSGIDRVITSGTAALNIDASAAGNSLAIIGNSASNILIGTAFADTMNGGSGGDIYLINSATEHNQAEIADNGTSGIDEVRFTTQTAGTLTLFAGDTGIEQAVIGTGSAVTANASGTAANNIDATLAPKGLTIIGNAGANILKGSVFDDILIGNAGEDSLLGGSGSDIYVFENSADHAAAEISDTGITGVDVIRYAATTAGTLTLFAGNVGIEQIIIGTGIGPAAVSTGTTALNVDASALTGPLLLAGNAGANTLQATVQDDIMNGGSGIDKLDGNEGADIYLIAAATEHSAAEFSDSGTAGFDEVRYTAAVAGTLTLYAGDTGIERVAIGTGTAAAAVSNKTTALNVNAAEVGNALAIFGNAGANIVTGTNFDDLIDGKGGNDKFNGLNGSDIYLITVVAEHTIAEINDSGTSGTDEVRFAATVNSTLTLFAGDTGIERVVIGTGLEVNAMTSATTALNVNAGLVANALTLIGNAGNNILTGTAHTDLIDGGEGSDIYIVNSADHHMASEFADSGLTGSDEVRFAATMASTLTVYAGDVGIERIVMGTGTAATAVSTATVALNINAAAAVNALTLAGNAGVNALIGTAQVDVIDGKIGIDILDGREEADIYIINAATEHPAAEIGDTGISGVDEVRFAATSASTLILYAGDSGIERVVTGTGIAASANTAGAAAVNVNASAVANGLTIIGNNGANTLIGTAFDDTLHGNYGNDIISGGAGVDKFVFDYNPNSTYNRDTITDFQSGTDILQFSLALFTGLGSNPGILSAEQFLSGAGAVSAQNIDDRLIYNTTTGILYYDADGMGGIPALQVALMGTTFHPGLNSSDIQMF